MFKLTNVLNIKLSKAIITVNAVNKRAQQIFLQLKTDFNLEVYVIPNFPESLSAQKNTVSFFQWNNFTLAITLHHYTVIFVNKEQVVQYRFEIMVVVAAGNGRSAF